MLSNNTILELEFNDYMMFFFKKRTGCARAVRMLKLSRVYTRAEILSKIFVKTRRKTGDLIYYHSLTN